jgi:hypothetical protein
MGVGLLSIAIAFIGGEEGASWAGYVYLLLFPALIAIGHLMVGCRRKSEAVADLGRC